MVGGGAAGANADPARPLAPALAAMTALQALVAIATFAPGVLAPKLGAGPREIGLFGSAVFVVAMATSMLSGRVVARCGSFGTAALCAAAVAAAMIVAGTAAPLAGWPGFVAAGLLLGLAFGPETPASSALLARLAPPARRPLIFSVRQTGNQIGAMLGSVSLPALALLDARLGFAAIVLLAGLAALVFLRLRPRYDLPADAGAARLGLGDAWRLVRGAPALTALAIVSVPFSAMQITLNVFFVTLAVERLGLGHVAAGSLLAVAQAGGLAGRLGWGVVATRWIAPRPLLIGIGAGMAACALAVAAATPAWPPALLVPLALLFGLTASGWNGVFLAEVARLAPDGRVSDATGAVLTASYAGLVAGPLLVGAGSALVSLPACYAGLAIATLLALPPLMRTPR